jgi:hypothetical protein
MADAAIAYASAEVTTWKVLLAVVVVLVILYFVGVLCLKNPFSSKSSATKSSLISYDGCRRTADLYNVTSSGRGGAEQVRDDTGFDVTGMGKSIARNKTGENINVNNFRSRFNANNNVGPSFFTALRRDQKEPQNTVLTSCEGYTEDQLVQALDE